MRQSLKMSSVIAVLLALLVTPVVFGFNPNTDESLVGWWPLNDGEGSTATDASGNGNDGDLEGDPTWVTGVLGGALEFDGDGDYVDTGNADQLDEYTFAIWVISPEAPASDSPSGPLHREGNYQINWNHSGGSSWMGSAAMYAGGWLSLNFDDLYANTWYHLASTFDGAEWITYQDGEEINSTTVSASIGSETNTLKLGRHAAAAQYFTGTVDDARVYSRALTAAEIKATMLGGENPALASLPSPGDGETDVALDAALSWQAGEFAVSHDVYLGTDYDDVNEASRSNPGTVLVSEGQEGTSFTPDELVLDGVYYWRIDEVNENPSERYKGTIWTFSAEPTYLNPVPVAVTASSFDIGEDFNCPPENTINGAGLNNGQHSSLASTMWRTAEGEIEGAWIQYEFDSVYQFNQMHVWNYNGENEAFLGVGVKDAVIKTSMDGETWTTLSDLQLSRATGLGTYRGEDVDMGDVVAQYVRIEIQSQHSFGGTTIVVHKTGLSEVHFEVVPIAARRPSPSVGETARSMFGDLVWRLGRGADTSRLYVSTDVNLIEAADESVLIDAISGRRYAIADTGAIYGEKYYWRVDQVAGDQVTAGMIWDFDTPDHLVIDDMEDYSVNNLIYETWLDGYDVDENGSEIGDGSPYVEQEIAFGGSQSMPMYYDTTDGEDAAWVELAVDSEIFTTGGVAQFSVMFKSDRTNDDGGQFYVEINNKRVYSPASLTSGLWTQLIADLSEFGNLNSADSLILGVNGQNLEGVVYIDDVCLYIEAPLLTGTSSEQPGNDTLVVHYAMESNLQDSVGNRDGQSGSGLTLFYETSLKEGIMNLGKALALDGEETSYVDVNDAMDDLVPTLTNSTYTAWVSIAEDSDESWMRVFDFGTGTENYMFLSPRSGTGGSPEFGIISPDSPSAVEQDVAGPALLTSGWHHLAVTIKQGDPNGLLTLYVDGVAMDTDETDTLPADLGTTTQNWLGRSQWESDGYYNGLLDEIRIYSEALSEAEIRWLAGDQ